MRIKYFKSNLKLKKIVFNAVEKSSLLYFFSKLVHSNYNIKKVNTKNFKNVDLIYDRQVSSYAFRNEDQLSKFINKSKIAYMNLSCHKVTSKNKNKIHNNGLDFSFFNLDKLKLKKNMHGFYLYGKINQKLNLMKNKNPRLDGFFLFCSEKNFKRFLLSLKKYKFLSYLKYKKFKKISKLNDKNFINC